MPWALRSVMPRLAAMPGRRTAGCVRWTGTQPPRAASYPGLPEERVPTGLVIIMAVLMALGVAANPAEAVGARCELPGQIAGLAAADAPPVTR